MIDPTHPAAAAPQAAPPPGHDPAPQIPGPPDPAAARPRGGSGAAALAVAGVLAVFFAPALLGSGQFVYRDTGRMHAPVKRWIGEELASGRLPQWNPYAGLGTPVVAGATDAVQHPLTLVFVALPPGAALKAWVLLSFALAAAGAFAWARALGASPFARAVAALAFALSGPLVSSSDNLTYLTTYASLPWLFVAAHLHAARGGPRGLALVAIASALTAAAGDPQAWGIAVGLLPAYSAAFADRGARRAALLRGIAASGAAAIAAAPFILPVVAWLPHTVRAGGLPPEELARWNVHPRRLIELVVPGVFRGDPEDPVSTVFGTYAGNDVTPLPWFLSLYVGAAAAALGAFGAWHDRRARALALATVAFAWAALGHHGGFTWLAARLPVVGGFRYWEKMVVWIALFAAIAAAIGADALLARRTRRLPWVAAALGAALLAIAASASVVVPSAAGGPAPVAAALASNVSSGAARAGLVLVLLAVVAALVARGRLTRAAPLALGAIVALDLFGGNAAAYVLGPSEPHAPPPLAAALAPGSRVFSPYQAREDLWPELGRLGSTWRWLRRTLAASWNVPLRIGTHHDYVGLRDRRWVAYRTALGEDHRYVRLGLFGFSAVVVPLDPRLAVKVGVPSPIRVVATDPELPASLVEVAHRPRVYLAGAVTTATEAEALAFAVGGGADGGTVVEAPVPAAYAPPRGDARLVRDLPGETVAEAWADGPALLVLNDGFAPGWAATVDGRPAAIVRTNGLVRGVWVDAGVHEVAFRYRTPGLAEGWAVALAGAAALSAWAIVRRARRRAAAPAAG